MSARLPSDRRLYSGASSALRFDHAAIEYPQACIPYNPSQYANSTGAVPQPYTAAMSVMYDSASTDDRLDFHPTSSRSSSVVEDFDVLPSGTSARHPATNHFTPENDSSTLAISTTYRSPTDVSTSGQNTSASTSKRPGKSRREKPRLELAPDQPLTTQGKPRTRVYVACVQCRSRKIRCDGAKPVCYNCAHRADTLSNDCTYDAAPKRRGPDRLPGARQRSAAGTATDDGEQRRRRRRRTSPPDEAGQATQSASEAQPLGSRYYSPTPPAPLRLPSPPLGSAALHEGFPSTNRQGLELAPIHVPIAGPSRITSHTPSDRDLPHSQVSFPSSFWTCPPGSTFSPRQTNFGYSLSHDYPSSTAAYASAATGSSGTTAYQRTDEDYHGTTSPELPAEPSVRYARDCWWEVILGLYAQNHHTHGQSIALTPGTRDAATQLIHNDLRFLFRYSSYWLSFINIPFLLQRLRIPTGRYSLQPSFVLGALAVATFLQSSESESGLGSRGRHRALRLCEEAQSALQASLSARWIDDNLVQASWIIAFFEVCAHPSHATSRVRSALSMLDSLIRCLSLTSMDMNDPRVTVFSPGIAPVISTSPTQPYPAWISPQASIPAPRQSQTATKCWCSGYTLVRVSPNTAELAPLWSHTPAWMGDWTEADIKKEECRRLVWSSIILVAGFTSYNAAMSQSQMELFIMDSANFALLFPGESFFPSTTHTSKESVWALYMRSLLLWVGCVRVRLNTTMSDAGRAQYLLDLWIEIDVVEESLKKHTCDVERTFLFATRDYLFLTRLSVFYDLQRCAPQAVDANVLRQKASEWLTHHDSMAKRSMCGLRTITGQPTSSLSGRPFYLWWFMGHIARIVTLYHNDRTLETALYTCKSLLAPMEYLMMLWPCSEVARRYQDVRRRLTEACYTAGIPSPSPISFPHRYLDGSI